MNAASLARFAADLDALVPPADRIGVAVSGGPDSLALLLLAAAARPGQIEAATVDHRLRADSGAEADMVAGVCGGLGVPHAILPIEWSEPPAGNLQARARDARYPALGQWALERGLAALATAHHLDDQAETLLMRLARGAGIGGLAGIRRRRPLAIGDRAVALVRPLLGWRRDELAAIVQAAGANAVDDPANRDPRHDRTRAREFLSGTDWPDRARLAASAAHLADAEAALQFAAAKLYHERHRRDGEVTIVDPTGLPREFQRRLLLIALQRRGAPPPRGPDLARLLAQLAAGQTATLAGFKLVGGATWRLSPAPPRRG
ncbi:MAG: tRNA lysidine(34) synthetase TilS [Sphingomicrobium sp.]